MPKDTSTPRCLQDYAPEGHAGSLWARQFDDLLPLLVLSALLREVMALPEVTLGGPGTGGCFT